MGASPKNVEHSGEDVSARDPGRVEKRKTKRSRNQMRKRRGVWRWHIIWVFIIETEIHLQSGVDLLVLYIHQIVIKSHKQHCWEWKTNSLHLHSYVRASL